MGRPAWPTGCGSPTATSSSPRWTAARRAIRAVDRRNIVWWEPQQFAGGQKLDTFYTAVPGSGSSASPGTTTAPTCSWSRQGIPGGDVENCWRSAATASGTRSSSPREMHAAPLMSEWGATDNLRAIEIDAAVADEHLMGWTHWAYKFWNDPTTADGDQGLFRDDADLAAVKRAKVRPLVRTYAQATAGTPLTMRFDAGSGGSGSATGPTARSPRRPGSSSARCTTRTGTAVAVEHGSVPQGRPLRAGPARLDREVSRADHGS